MTGYSLIAARDAASTLASVFGQDAVCRIEVLEDQCFKDGHHLALGEIRLSEAPGDLESASALVARGSYIWVTPPRDEVLDRLEALLGVEVPPANASSKVEETFRKTKDRVARTLDSIAAAAFRLGLAHPSFDPASVEEMCDRHGTTIVADTSGVLQGGLDFVARFLHPAARIKVPAVVHMEVIQQADNFLKQRRSATKRSNSHQLFDHVLSQSGQRALLRLELRADTEIERSPLMGDPLRNAFQKDGDQELAELGLSVPLRGYVDRLILESTRQHQAQSSPGHHVQLLTADQGLARMALAEGIAPLFFQASKANDLFGRRLSGTVFSPFSADIYRVSLESVLWELATAFGSAKIISADGKRWAVIAAIGHDLVWSPVHSRNDLLWLRSEGLPSARILEEANLASERGEGPDSVEVLVPKAKKPVIKTAKPKKAVVREVRQPRSLSEPAGYYRLNIERLFKFFVAAADEGVMKESKALEVLGSVTPGEYRRFLLAGAFAEIANAAWTLTEAGLTASTAIKQVDCAALLEQFVRVKSVASFVEAMRAAPTGHAVNPPLPERSRTTYLGLGEILCIGATVAGQGYFPTHASLGLTEFVEVALRRFQALDTGDGYVSAGSWLEALVLNDGIHPVVARNQLAEASAAGLVRRSTEGSTLDTRHDDHAIQILKMHAGAPRVDLVHLYRGDFLIPQKSSSSIRLERPVK